MDEKCTDCVTITIPKPRICAKESVSKINFSKKKYAKIVRNPSADSMRKYLVHDDKPLKLQSLKKNDDVLYSYTLYAKNENKVKHRQRLAIGILDKYMIAYSALRRRLHVEDPVDDVLAVTDIDKNYFRYLNGCRLQEHIPIFKSLKCLFNKQLRLKHEIGCRRDCVLNIEYNQRKELELYDISVYSYMEQVRFFDKFISEDYTKSMEFLMKWEELKEKVKAKIFELENYATDKFTLKARLIGVEYMYGLQQKYGRFLYYLSPPSWRAKNREFARSIEIEAKGFDLGTSHDEDAFNVIFEIMRNECSSGLIKPALYFTQPQHLMDIFESMEKQQLHHFTYVTHLAPHAVKLKGEINQLKEYISADSATVLHLVKFFEMQLQFAENTKSLLETKFFKVLDGLFFDSVGATDVLKLQLHLEFCYEKVFIDKPTNMSIFAIAKALEDYYMNYLFKLDEIHSNRVKLATTQYIEIEKNKLKRAKIAARELRLFERLERSLLRAFAPIATRKTSPDVTVYQPTKRKSTRHISKTYIKKNNQHQLTEAEIEYLSLFTDWTKDEDPSRYMYIAKEGEASNHLPGDRTLQ